MDASSTVAFALAAVPIVIMVILTALAAKIVWQIWSGEMDISKLLSNSADASLSRFQFLIFTFVIGFSYLMILCFEVVHNGAGGVPSVVNAAHAAVSAANPASAAGVPVRIELPDASGAAWLLGISAGGYALGKGIQTSGDTATKNAEVTANAAAGAAAAVATGQQTVARTVTTTPGGGASGTVTSTTPAPPEGDDGES
jgi:hypothetical protein